MKIEKDMKKISSKYIEDLIESSIRDNKPYIGCEALMICDSTYLKNKDSTYVSIVKSYKSKISQEFVNDKLEEWSRPFTGWDYKDAVFLNLNDKINYNGSNLTFSGIYEDEYHCAIKKAVFKDEDTNLYIEIDLKSNLENINKLKKAILETKVLNNKLKFKR